MSFASQVKKELLEACPAQLSRQRAQAYGMVLFGRSFSGSSISFQTENKSVADLYIRYLFDFAGLQSGVTTIQHRKQKGCIYLVTVDDQDDRRRILTSFGHAPEEANLRIRLENLDPDTAASFISGAYLVCGNITDPQKNYHAELTVPHLKLCEDLSLLLHTLGSHPKHTVRRGVHLLYYKESEQIEDLLTLIGAVKSSLDLMNVKIYKDVRNKINRITNCETANIEKTVAASSSQVEDIRLIWQVKGEKSLPGELQELARLRVENPELSLRELGESLSEPITRSGVNHRLKRLSAIAQELRERGAVQ